MLFSDQLEQIMSYYRDLMGKYIKILNASPKGSLISQPNHNGTQFLQLYRENGKRIRNSITRDEAMLRALAKKEFARKALEILEPNVKTLEKAIDDVKPFDVDEILGSMTKGYAKLI